MLAMPSDHNTLFQSARLRTITPWSVITIVGCLLLTLIDLWRDGGPSTYPLIQGTLPNLLAVPILTFGFLMLRFSERIPQKDFPLLKKWFYGLLASATVVTAAWEFTQLWGALVFDPNDLYATGLGVVLSWLLFRIAAPLSFRSGHQT